MTVALQAGAKYGFSCCPQSVSEPASGALGDRAVFSAEKVRDRRGPSPEVGHFSHSVLTEVSTPQASLRSSTRWHDPLITDSCLEKLAYSLVSEFRACAAELAASCSASVHEHADSTKSGSDR